MIKKIGTPQAWSDLFENEAYCLNKIIHVDSKLCLVMAITDMQCESQHKSETLTLVS